MVVFIAFGFALGVLSAVMLAFCLINKDFWLFGLALVMAVMTILTGILAAAGVVCSGVLTPILLGTVITGLVIKTVTITQNVSK